MSPGKILPLDFVISSQAEGNHLLIPTKLRFFKNLYPKQKGEELVCDALVVQLAFRKWGI